MNQHNLAETKSWGANVPEMCEMRLLKVNEVARELGCSETWLRRSEQRGRIPRARRDLNGWRVYTEADVEALRQILFPGKPDSVESQNSPDAANP